MSLAMRSGDAEVNRGRRPKPWPIVGSMIEEPVSIQKKEDEGTVLVISNGRKPIAVRAQMHIFQVTSLLA
jgi:hypothetical protein